MPDSGARPDPTHKLVRVHVIEKRARLRVEDPLSREQLIALADQLASTAGVDRVLARPSTGSLIIEAHSSVADVLKTIEDAGLATLANPPKQPPVSQMVQLGLARADFDLQRQTEGALDLRTALGLMLLAGAILQLARGQIAGPATTLAASALSLLDRK